jgi:hypothetical protein
MEHDKNIEIGKIHINEHILSLVINNEKVKDPGKVADVSMVFF